MEFLGHFVEGLFWLIVGSVLGWFFWNAWLRGENPNDWWNPFK